MMRKQTSVLKTSFQNCVCVCTLLITCSLNIDLAGECGMIVGPHSTKLPQSWDTGSDQPSVPASEDSNRLSWEPETKYLWYSIRLSWEPEFIFHFSYFIIHASCPRIRFRPSIQELVVLLYFTSLRSNLYIPQCVLGTLPHLVVPSVRFDGYESYDRAFSRLQSGMSPTSWSPLCILHAKEVDNVKVDIEVRSTQIDSHKAKFSPIGEVPTREKLSHDEVLWMRTSTSTCGHILSLEHV